MSVTLIMRSDNHYSFVFQIPGDKKKMRSLDLKMISFLQKNFYLLVLRKIF